MKHLPWKALQMSSLPPCLRQKGNPELDKGMIIMIKNRQNMTVSEVDLEETCIRIQG